LLDRQKPASGKNLCFKSREGQECKHLMLTTLLLTPVGLGAYKKLDPNIIAIIKFKFTSELKVGTNPIDK